VCLFGITISTHLSSSLTRWRLKKVAPLAYVRDLGLFLHNLCPSVLYLPSASFSISLSLV
jgi:hypothetical protein